MFVWFGTKCFLDTLHIVSLEQKSYFNKKDIVILKWNKQCHIFTHYLIKVVSLGLTIFASDTGKREHIFYRWWVVLMPSWQDRQNNGEVLKPDCTNSLQYSVFSTHHISHIISLRSQCRMVASNWGEIRSWCNTSQVSDTAFKVLTITVLANEVQQDVLLKLSPSPRPMVFSTVQFRYGLRAPYVIVHDAKTHNWPSNITS
jgi:hypothetical protein